MARRELNAEIEIDAPPERVWEVLTDFSSYEHWNPFLVKMGGQPVEKAKLIATFKPPGGKQVRMRPRVLVSEPNRELRWLGRVWFPNIFDGEHSFVLEPLDGNRTRFIQHEKFKGILVGAFKKTLDRTQIGFEQMNEALKRRAERL